MLYLVNVWAVLWIKRMMLATNVCRRRIYK